MGLEANMLDGQAVEVIVTEVQRVFALLRSGTETMYTIQYSSCRSYCLARRGRRFAGGCA